jgi:DNA-binding transcriptional ArsR family regulator
MSRTEINQEGLQSLAGIDRLVHEPARLMILTVLAVVESADFLFVMRQTGLTRGNLSSHMSKLEKAGYVCVEKEFVDKIPRTLLRLSEQGRAALEVYREGMMQALGNVPKAPPSVPSERGEG